MINFVITLKWVLLVITLTQASADDTHGIEKRGTNSDSKKVVCYYTNWSVYRPGTAKFSPQNINPYLCTHLIYAFGGLDKENGLRPYDKYQDIEQGGYAKFTGLKTYNKNLKTMLAIGGWNEGSSRFSALVADEDRRAIFVKNVVKFLRQNNFDGLDLDWEYPAFRDGSKPADKDNYASLVKELREEFDRESSKTGRSRLLLTMAVPAGVEYIDKGYDVPKLNKYLDFMNILSYDYHSAYEPNVNHHSPLYSLQEESEYNFDAQLTIDHTVKHFLKKGADREKLVLGIPTYGRSYTLFNPDSADLGSPADGPGEQGEATREKGYLAYYEICGNLENDKQWKVVQPKKSAMGPYAYRGNQWVSYDDADIVKLKAKYVNEKGLGGIMYWSIDNDDFRGKCHGKPYPLIEAGKESLLASSGSSINSISVTGEEKRSKLAGKRNRPKSQNLNTTTKQPSTTTSTTTTASNPLSTPEPPTTPDPGTDFVCKEEGFFPHPRDCKKYFWCLDSGPSNLGIVAHQFTCPSGLMFNKAADSCDYSRNVICNKKSEKTAAATTTTTLKTTSLASTTNKPGTTTTTTTTTTTEAPAVEEDYEEEDADSQEDPKAIKQLITLIKKLGGIAELEKQLKLEDGSVEVTTPAISKNLYNKVFSAPATSRFKNQHRNGPSGPQHEGITSSDDVPYYKKDKPQYVTIQRSRPLKNIPQDTEDSETTNNKSVQPNKYQETTDYVDDVTEGETTTVKYSSPRFRSSGADSRTTSLKYVVLERNKSDRTTTSDEELTAESPSSTTTQRYITLVRHRPSTAATEYEEEITNTEPPTQRTSQKFHSRYETEERVTEKPKEKVSEIETTAYLPVTSAQNRTDRPQTLSTAEYAETTTVIPSTYSYLVFPEKNDEILKKADDISTIESRDLETYITEAYIPSTLTTVITTIRESPTEKARIPLRRYKEYLKSNKTDILSELRSNYILTKKSKEISTAESFSTSATFNGDFSPTTRRTAFSRKRTNYTLPTTENSKSTSTENAVHSRFFIRRNKGTTSSTTIMEASTNSSSESTTSSLFRKTTKSPESSEESGEILKAESDESTPKYKSRFRPKYQSSTPPESDGISSFFKKRRLSTTEKPVELTSASTKVSSRYFSRNRKTSPQTTEATSTENSSPSTKYVKSNAFRKTTQSEILDSDENRYEIPERTTIGLLIESNTQSNFDTFGTWTKNASFESNTSSGIESTTEQKTSSNHSTSENNVSPTNRFNEIGDNSTTNTNGFDASVTERASSKNGIETASEVHPKTFRNNSRFLKNPEPEYNVYTDGTRVNRIRGQAKYSADEKVHRFSSPIYVVQKLHDNQIEYPHRNEFRVKVTKKIPSSKGRALEHVEDSENAQTVQSTRGAKKFFDHLNNAVNTVVENSTTIIKTENRSRGRSRLVNSSFSTSSGPEIGTRKPTRPPIVATDSYENESRGRPRVYTASPVYVTSTYVPETRARLAVQETTISTIGNDVKSRRRSRVQNFNTLNVTEHVKQHETPITPRVLIKSRGKIKAQNSLSQAEIRELVAPAEVKPKQKPKTIVEETFVTNGDNFGYNKLITIPDILERSFEETTDTIYVPDGNSITTEYYENVEDNDVFRVSETKYVNEKFVSDSQDIKKLRSRPTSDAAESTMATEQTEEPPPRYRENFRRTTSPRSRSRSTTTTTTTTEHIPSNESSKLSSRFRRRKIKPENRSISTGRTENFVTSSYQGEVSTSRPKSVDISQRGSTTISDYLPVPAPLYSVNHTSNLDRYNIDAVNLEDLEAQTLNTQTSYYNTEDVSDLANPAVVAIHNLKTVPPASSQVTFTKPALPIASHVTYAEEVSRKPFPRIKSTPTTTALPFSKSRTSIRRGTVRLSTKATTTTQIPSLQDIYNDYHETDVEYHADPVEIPITGKVRIHSDGYIECLDMGNFPHPFSCKKFISCAKMEYDSLLGWEYTCPKGLSFDPIGGICNWAAGLGCKE